MTDEALKFKAFGEMAQRSRADGANYVLLADFDRVTAERDAALNDAESLRESLRTQTLIINSIANARDALQQRLTAADERVDVLDGLLRKHASHVAALADALFRSGACMAKEFSELTYAALEHQQVVNAALKPAEGRGDHAKHYECIGKGGDYTIVAIAQGAGTLKGFNHYVYKNADGVHFVRDPEDFLSSMQIKP